MGVMINLFRVIILTLINFHNTFSISSHLMLNWFELLHTEI